MSLMRSNQLRFASFVLSAMALLTAFSPVRSHAESTVVVPENALGFAYIDIHGLGQTRDLAFVNRIVNHVSTEASVLSLTRGGLDVTTIREVTLVVPPMEIVATSDAPPVVAAVQLDKSFRPRDVARRLGEFMQPVSANGNDYLVQNDACIHILSNDLLLVGTSSAVQWYVENKTTTSTIDPLLAKARSDSHLSVVADMRQIPVEVMIQEMLQSPGPANLSGLQFLECTLVIDEVYHLRGNLHCADESHAEGFAQRVNDLRNQTVDEYVTMDRDMQTQLKSGDLQQAITILGTLAGIREGIEFLDGIQVGTNENVASASLQIDMAGAKTVFLALAAIAAIGESSADAKFRDVESQLTAPSINAN